MYLSDISVLESKIVNDRLISIDSSDAGIFDNLVDVTNLVVRVRGSTKYLAGINNLTICQVIEPSDLNH